MNAPAFAASHDAPSPGSLVMDCRTNGQGGGNCQGYRLVVNFNVQGTTSWNIRITTAQITSSAGVTESINLPTAFPYVVSPTSQAMNLWFCSASSPSGLTLNISYSAWRVGSNESTAVVQSFPQAVYAGGSIPVC
ncbi:hypothetical protein CXG46_08390 [Nocardioides alpinus]|uniref:Uncharacterized protein n=1 Tax=Nocardioides alpinus TaxID=748909 RepID=A0ABX4QYC6_9ACTN|nr:hypothetical protein CXG46_08390 [Nocardioides alpinus]